MLDTCTERLEGILADAERLMFCESPSDDLAAIARSADVVTEVVGDALRRGWASTSTPERIVVTAARTCGGVWGRAGRS